MSDKYAITENDKGFKVDRRVFETREHAEEYRNALLQADAIASTPDLSDLDPEGVDFRINDRIVKFRDSLLELPMNETHLPDGSLNPYYDRAWYWHWAALVSTDIADKQATGYKLVSFDELTEGVKNERVPEHYLNFVREEGSYLVFGDCVLMRKPRKLWRQQRAERTKRALSAFERVDAQQKDNAARIGLPEVESPVKNELSIRL